ncbi:probable maleylacetoacetate isomerase 1 isoform X2 [Galleria mellonella]|uniref:maleylacetoacetate isomerase n=1 Tax=Galleria mellonella TaxID=7137 RepID=A0A6J1X4J0_GALME|nr:probable maleylacetoacetate isomerase 1 isoform X2 [Galleria mellonella]
MGGESRAILYGFWSSSCSWRVRAGLNLKSIVFEERNIDIVKEQSQLTDKYKNINPSQKVPALIIDGQTLVESMAILQYLEDTRPEPRLTPNDPLQKARMREICETIVSGIQPLQNIGLKSHFTTEYQYQQFTKYWCDRGLQTLENLLQKTTGLYCVGDQITMADLCLVPQLFNATTRLELSLDKYPTLSRLYKNLLKEKVFEETHPKAVRPKP